MLLVHWLWVTNETMWLIITTKCHEVWIFMPLSMKCDRQPILKRQFHLVWGQENNNKYISLSKSWWFMATAMPTWKQIWKKMIRKSQQTLFICKIFYLSNKKTLFIYAKFLTHLCLSMIPLTLENKQKWYMIIKLCMVIFDIKYFY